VTLPPADGPAPDPAVGPVIEPLRPPGSYGPLRPPDPPLAAEPSATASAIPLVPTRRLLTVAFDLLVRSGEDMRRASFYIGALVLGTVGPLVLGVLILGTEGLFGPAFDPTLDPLTGDDLDGSVALGGALLSVLAIIAFLGLLVAVVEGRNLGITVLGGTMAGQPVTTRQALARSRKVFWPSVGAAFLIGVPVGLAQAAATAVLDAVLVESAEIGVVVSTLVAAVVGAPFAYALAGVVLGDVGPVEAVRRSFRVFRARRAAAFIVVLFETIAFLLVVLGLSSGLDIVVRVFSVLGLGPDSGPAGFLLTALGIVALVFATGTLLFTVYALTVAPQVVMFLSLTHATIGLDKVRPGGAEDPDRPRRFDGPFRWFTPPLVTGWIIAAVGLVGIVIIALG
jgi:hypothetical protein